MSISLNPTISASVTISPTYYVGPPENGRECLAVIGNTNSVRSDKSNDKYTSADLVSKVCPGDLICYFCYPTAFVGAAGLVWNCITSIRINQYKVHGPVTGLCIL